MKTMPALARTLGQALARLGGGSLAVRFVALSLLLLLLVQAAGFGVVRSTIAQGVARQVQAELQVGERVWLRLLDNRAQRLHLAATVLAADYGFRAAVASDDVDTLLSALDNHGGRIHAAVTALLDPDFRPRASVAADGRALPERLLHDVAEAAATGGSRSTLAVLDGQLLQFVAVAVRTPLPNGWVMMGFPVGQAMLDDLRALAGLESALRVATAPGAVAVLASTLPPQAAPALAGLGAGSAARAPDADSAALALALGDDLLQARPVALPAVGGQVHALLLRSTAEVAAPMQRLQWVLLAITASGVLLFALGSVWNARRVTAPLLSLVQTSRALGRRDLDVPVPALARRDEIGHLARAFDTMRVEIRLHQQELERLAYVDRLIQLPNRAGFAEAVRGEIARADPTDGRLAVLMLDLDRFKHVNDVLGYALGDRLLKAVARRLVDEVARAGDTVARLGGDEFALLLPGADLDAAKGAAARVARALDRPLVLDEQTVDLGAGVGIARWPDDADDVDTLLTRAEVAMYGAKHAREGVRVYDPAHDSGSAHTLSLLSQLRRAIDAGELRLYLQPKVDLASRRLVGAETLVRWQHPQRGLVPPLDFIPFAEQTGFVRQLTLWVFEEAARHWRSLAAGAPRGTAPDAPPGAPSGAPLRLAVNLSTRDLMDVDLPARFSEILRRHEVPAAAFCLEITESAIMDDPARALATLRVLADAGFKLSIDDFGTGYSSLAYLQRLPVNELKIDRSFVKGLATNAGDAAIVRSTIDLAHHLQLSVVAEGIEDAALFDALAAMGCDEGQGYHLSRPLPLEEFRAWAARWVAAHGTAQDATPA